MKCGLVVKIKKKTCILLTPEGDYLEVPLPKEGALRVGQEWEAKPKKNAYLRYLAVAACLLVFICAGQFYAGQTPVAAAYLTIDINPSIEIAVSVDGKVISARGLNSDGEMILSKVNIIRHNLREAVEAVISQAVADQYLMDKTDDNIILVTLTVNDGVEPVLGLDTIYEAIREQVEPNNIDVEVIIEPVRQSMRKEAEQAGISTGRHFLLTESEKKGVPLSVNEITSGNLGKLEKAKEVTFVELVEKKERDQGDKALNGKAEGHRKQALKGIYAHRRVEKGNAGNGNNNAGNGNNNAGNGNNNAGNGNNNRNKKH